LITKTPLRTVLQNDNQELFFIVKKELPGLQDFRMIKRNIQICLSLSIDFEILGDWNKFKGVILFVESFDSVYFAKTSFSEFVENFIVVDFSRHDHGEKML
jgi:hypothetical protein